MTPFSFSITKKLSGKLGRVGVIHTPHGDIETPAFTVVGTKATVKALSPEDVRDLVGAQAVLVNTYHLYLQPGEALIKDAGGLHTFMHWDGPTLSDSGGFQVFSLGAGLEGKGEKRILGASQDSSRAFVRDETKDPMSGQRRYGVTKFTGEFADSSDDMRPRLYNKEIALQHGKLCILDEEGVTFTSHLDGSLHRFTAERSIEIQHAIGADIMFAFDECTSPTADYVYQKEALERTHRWAKRSILAHKRDYNALKSQALYGIVQGGRFEDLRKGSATELAKMDFDGYSFGGAFSKEDLKTLEWVNAILPEEKPRHLLGIGEPEDLFIGVENGMDTFDCVLPTRIARTGTIYTHHGKVNLLRTEYQRDLGKPDDTCDCYTCTHYTRAYLAHLFRAKEMLAARLASIHNLHFIVSLIKNIRRNILDDTYPQSKENFLRTYRV
ncbi:tRNA guanosine(34) transglycosylase Tgt [Candidatus Kaiserbacteria bacterium]|nr:tRNA guanosine(34) transglycosylase Tgt [Candidatus Kaiserbacteria bacterium]